MTNENKKSNLEKEAGILGNLFIKNITPFIPFTSYNKNVAKHWGNYSEKLKNRSHFDNAEGEIRESINIWVSAGFISSIVFYGALSFAVGRGSFDYTKWPEIEKQRCFEREAMFRDAAKKRFNEYDINKDGVLNQNEFFENYTKYVSKCWDTNCWEEDEKK